MQSDLPHFVLTIPSDPQLLGSARAFIMAVCEGRDYQAAALEAVVLAVHEALNNVIRHAHQHRCDVPLEIRCYPWPDRLEIHILDEGDPFDLSLVPHLDPAEVRIGGRGVFLMRRLTDELTCQPREARGNILRIVKRICREENTQPASPSAP